MVLILMDLLTRMLSKKTIIVPVLIFIMNNDAPR